MVVALEDQVDTELGERVREVDAADLVVVVLGVGGRRVDRVVVAEHLPLGLGAVLVDDVGHVLDVRRVTAAALGGGIAVAVEVDEQHILVDVPVVTAGRVGRRVAVGVQRARAVRVRGGEVLLVRLAADVVVTDGGSPRVLTELVGGQEGVPLGLGVRGLDLVTARQQQFGVGVGRQRDVHGVLPTGLVLRQVAGRADLRVAEEQEVVVALEVLRLERVRRGPVALGAHAVGVRRVLLQARDRRVAVEAAAGRDVRRAGGVEVGGVRRELAVDERGGRGDLELLRGVGRGVPGHGALGLVGAHAEYDAGERCGFGGGGGGRRTAAEGHGQAQECRCGPSGRAAPYRPGSLSLGARFHWFFVPLTHMSARNGDPYDSFTW